MLFKSIENGWGTAVYRQKVPVGDRQAEDARGTPIEGHQQLRALPCLILDQARCEVVPGLHPPS